MKTRKKAAVIVGLAPPVLAVAGLPWANSTTPVLGLPLLAFWITLWTALVPAFLFTAGRLSGREPTGATPEEKGAAR